MAYKILCDNLKANCNKNQLKQRNDAYKSDILEKTKVTDEIEIDKFHRISPQKLQLTRLTAVK